MADARMGQATPEGGEDGPDAVALRLLRRSALAFAGTFLTTHASDSLRKAEAELAQRAVNYAATLDDVGDGSKEALYRRALERIRALLDDRQRFVMQGMRSFSAVDEIVHAALKGSVPRG